MNLYGAFILNGVIEEKTSRVVEILLSTVRAEELLLGKVLGIGIVGTIQGAVLVLATFIARANVQNTDGGGLSVSVVLYTVLWFLIGFGMYAWLYACAGSLVSRSEDSQSLVFLLQVPLLVSYLVAFIATVNGPTPVGTALSIFPLTAPMIMLERMAAQEVPFWQVCLCDRPVHHHNLGDHAPGRPCLSRRRVAFGRPGKDQGGVANLVVGVK